MVVHLEAVSEGKKNNPTDSAIQKAAAHVNRSKTVEFVICTVTAVHL